MPREKAKSSPPNTHPERKIPRAIMMILQETTSMTTPQRIMPTTIPGHQALDGSKKTEPRNKPPHPSQNTSEKRIAKGSVGSLGSSTISPLRSGSIRVIPSVIPSKYLSSWNAGTKFSSMIRLAVRSVMTHSRPLPTSIRTSLSDGTRRIRRPLSATDCPIHHHRAMAIDTSSIVLFCRLERVATEIWWCVSASSVSICCSRVDFSVWEKIPASSYTGVEGASGTTNCAHVLQKNTKKNERKYFITEF